MRTSWRILMVVANPFVTPAGHRVGFWAAELTHPHFEFTRSGCEVTVASPEGGSVEFDALSDPRHPSGHSAHDVLTLGYLQTPWFIRLISETPAIDACQPKDFDAIFIAGGSSPMFTFAKATALQRIFLEFHNARKVVSTLCHGGALLLFLKMQDGSPFVSHRRFTSSSNAKEDIIAQKVGPNYFPFRIEDEAIRQGAHFVATPDPLDPFAVRDKNLVTGQQEYSGFETARLVLEVLHDARDGHSIPTTPGTQS